MIELTPDILEQMYQEMDYSWAYTNDKSKEIERFKDIINNRNTIKVSETDQEDKEYRMEIEPHRDKQLEPTG